MRSSSCGWTASTPCSPWYALNAKLNPKLNPRLHPSERFLRLDGVDVTHPLHGRYRYISVTQVRDNVGNTRVMESVRDTPVPYPFHTRDTYATGIRAAYATGIRDTSVPQVRDNVGNTRVMEAACFLLGNVASSAEGLARIAANDGAALALKIVRQHDKDTGLYM